MGLSRRGKVIKMVEEIVMQPSEQFQFYSLRPERYFARDYWKSISECSQQIDWIVLVDLAYSLRRSPLIRHCRIVGDSVLCPSSVLALKRENSILMGLVWFGAPCQVVFCSQDERQLKLISENYEVESSDEASPILLGDAQPWMDKARGILPCKYSYRWCFTPDADFAVVAVSS